MLIRYVPDFCSSKTKQPKASGGTAPRPPASNPLTRISYIHSLTSARLARPDTGIADKTELKLTFLSFVCTTKFLLW